MKNIVILGAGFGGLRTALQLEKIIRQLPGWRIILVDKNSYHLYTPALYEVATAYRWKGFRADLPQDKLAPRLGAAAGLPIRQIIANKDVEFLQAEVSGVDLGKNEVLTTDGDKIDFSYIVFALGAESTYFGVEGAKENTLPIKTIQDALRVRQKIENKIQSLSLGQTLNFVIVGGGFTGVELAAESAGYIRHLLRERGLPKNNVRLILMEAGEQILAGAPSTLVKKAEKRLKGLGVEINTGKKITGIEKDKVVFGEAKEMEADLVIWSGGVVGCSTCRGIQGLELDERGRIIVDSYLRCRGVKNAFALGDIIPGPGTAWAAEQEADVIAQNLERSILNKPLEKFHLKFPGFVAAAGDKYAVAHLFGITFSGFSAWVLKKLIDLKYFMSLFPFWQALGIWVREIRLFTKND